MRHDGKRMAGGGLAAGEGVMLSPGKWHKKVPRERLKNLCFRQRLVAGARASVQAQRALREACRQDVLFYVNAFVWQYNPRKKGGGEVGPFITWPFQEEAILTILDCIEHDEDLLIEKSREMGASWLCLLVMEWLWHFHSWQKFLCISRNENAVEDDDPDSLFWKIDFVHRYLPAWLLPDMKRRKLFYGNEENHSSITGQASTGRAGVGGRATAMFIDEFSQVKEDYEVLHRTSDTTGCRIFNGTHKGHGTAFHELSLRVDMRKLVMHWTEHPDKRPGLYRWNAQTNQVEVLDHAYRYPAAFDFVMAEAPAGGPHPGLRSPWYDRECGRKGSPRAVAMDLDIDAGGSVAQFFNPVTVRTLKATYATAPLWEGELTYDRDRGRPVGTGLVRVPGGALRLWVHPTPEGKLSVGPYGMGADIAAGTGKTNSCLSVVDARTGEKVLEYATPFMTPEVFAPLAAAVGWLFMNDFGEPARFAWEHAGPGLIFGRRLLETGYRNIYYRESVTVGTVTQRQSNLPGWYPSNDTKRLLLEEYRAALDSRQFINHSELALEECLPYRYTSQGTVEHPRDSGMGGDDPSGARGNHGDRVIADALAWMMSRKYGIVTEAKGGAAEVQVGTLAWRRQLAETAERDRRW